MSGSLDETSDARFMRRALVLAERAGAQNEVPVGAVVVVDGAIIGEGFNRTIVDCDPGAHAEMVALRTASRQAGNYRLPGATLYSTLEPCSMCAGAIIQARIARVVYGCTDPKTGAVDSLYALLGDSRLNHQCDVQSGVMAQSSSDLLRQFFARRRARN